MSSSSNNFSGAGCILKDPSSCRNLAKNQNLQQQVFLMHRFETKGVKHYTADFSYKELVFFCTGISRLPKKNERLSSMSNESTGSRWQLAVGPAGGSSWIAAAARAVYVTQQMTWVLLKYGHQSRSLMPLVEVKKFARLICQFCISLACPASARGSNEEPERRTVGQNRQKYKETLEKTGLIEINKKMGFLLFIHCRAKCQISWKLYIVISVKSWKWSKMHLVSFHIFCEFE